MKIKNETEGTTMNAYSFLRQFLIIQFALNIQQYFYIKSFSQHLLQLTAEIMKMVIQTTRSTKNCSLTSAMDQRLLGGSHPWTKQEKSSFTLRKLCLCPYRRKGNGRRCCFGDRIDSKPCHASYFAPGFYEKQD